MFPTLIVFKTALKLEITQQVHIYTRQNWVMIVPQ